MSTRSKSSAVAKNTAPNQAISNSDKNSNSLEDRDGRRSKRKGNTREQKENKREDGELADGYDGVDSELESEDGEALPSERMKKRKEEKIHQQIKLLQHQLAIAQQDEEQDQGDDQEVSSVGTSRSKKQKQDKEDVNAQQQIIQSHELQTSSRPHKREPRMTDLKGFEGIDFTVLDDWLDNLSRLAEYYDMNDSEVVKYGVVHLEKSARAWWVSLGQKEKVVIVDLKTLSSALRSRFQVITSKEVARMELHELRQGNRHVNAYIADFQRLSALLPISAEVEEERCFQFCLGLKEDIRRELVKLNVTTLTGSIETAARIGNLPSNNQSMSQARLHQMGMSANNEETLISQTDNTLNRMAEAINMLAQAQTQGTPNSGVGAKTRTKRDYSQTGSQLRTPLNRFPPQVPGVPSELVQQRYEAKQCLRCGDPNHRALACPNAISSKSSF